MALSLLAVIIGVVNIGVKSGSSGFETGDGFQFGGGKSGVALVQIHGIIVSDDESPGFTSAQKTVEQLDLAVDDSSVAAVLLDVDSPGGDSGAVKQIYDAVIRLKRKKPVVAAVSGNATAGGYYIASASDRIFAFEASTLGYIGAVMIHVNAGEYLKNSGIRVRLMEDLKYGSTPFPLSDLTPGESGLYTDLLQDAYQQFLNDVSEGRGQSIKAIRNIGEGRIFSGKQAKSEQIIDDIGGRKEALEAIRVILKTGQSLSIFKPAERGILDLLKNQIRESKTECPAIHSPVLYLYPGSLTGYKSFIKCITPE
jgi:protease-4